MDVWAKHQVAMTHQPRNAQWAAVVLRHEVAVEILRQRLIEKEHQRILFLRIEVLRLVENSGGAALIERRPAHQFARHPAVIPLRVYIADPVKLLEVLGPEVIRLFLNRLTFDDPNRAPSDQIWRKVNIIGISKRAL